MNPNKGLIKMDFKTRRIKELEEQEFTQGYLTGDSESISKSPLPEAFGRGVNQKLSEREFENRFVPKFEPLINNKSLNIPSSSTNFPISGLSSSNESEPPYHLSGDFLGNNSLDVSDFLNKTNNPLSKGTSKDIFGKKDF